jgi:hypothetical protein
MKTNNQELKRAYREFVQSSSGTQAKNCPAPQEIWSLFTGRKSRKKKGRMMDHITTCSSCFREFEAFLEISRAEGNLVHAIEPRFGSRPRKSPLPMAWRYATAFLIVIAVLAATMISTDWLNFNKRPEERGRLSGQLRLLAPGQEPSLRAPLLFRWEGISRPEYYIVEIFDDSLLPFWKSSPLTGTSCELPLAVKEKMERGKSYFWMLTAFSAGGTKTESSLEEFRLIDRPAP